MSYEDDALILKEYEAWKRELKYREKEATVETFLIERTRDTAYDKLAEIDQEYTILTDPTRLDDHITKLEEFADSVATILGRNE